jgi:type II secretory pathway pseudopilin PulG
MVGHIPGVETPGYFREVPSGQCSHRACAAFTMVEIALCLGVIGFALVAIIGVLPTGMNVQKENREETIINQDATVLMNAIRGGAQGLDDLTNYVVSITNTVNQYAYTAKGPTLVPPTHYYGYTTYLGVPPLVGVPPLTNGAIIIGLLSTPKIVYYTEPPRSGGYFSNHIVAVFRSMSGAAGEKVPQADPAMLDLAFAYRLIPEVVPFCDYDTNWAYIPFPNWKGIITTNEFINRSNYLAYVKNLTNSLYDVRLTFRWPVFPGGSVGPGRQVFRAPATGTLVTNLAVNTPPLNPNAPTPEPPNLLYFFQPAIYSQAH